MPEILPERRAELEQWARDALRRTISDMHRSLPTIEEVLAPERLAEVERERDAAHDALRSLASWLSVGGYNADAVDAAEFERKIRAGVDALVRVETARARGPQISDSEQTALLRRTIAELEAECDAAEDRASAVKLAVEDGEAFAEAARQNEVDAERERDAAQDHAGRLAGLLRRSLAFRDDSDPAEYSAFLAEVMDALKETP